MTRQYFQKQQRRIVRIQCLWRVKKAREVYRELKRELRISDFFLEISEFSVKI